MKRIIVIKIVSIIGCSVWIQSAHAETKLWNNGSGAIVDVTTGLMWQAQPPSPSTNGFVRADYCRNLTLSGSSEWRIPTLKEWFSLIDFNRKTAVSTDTYYFDIKNYPELARHGEYLSFSYFPDARFTDFEFLIQFRPRSAQAISPQPVDVENLDDRNRRLLCVTNVPEE